MQSVTWDGFHLERIPLRGSEVKEKRKCFYGCGIGGPSALDSFLFLICNHFLAGVLLLFFFFPTSYSMLPSVNGLTAL